MRRLLWLLIAVASLSVLADETAESPAGRFRPPVPLRAPVPRAPMETAGTDLAPSVAIRAHVSDRGAVTDVEVLRIQPSSRFDHLFESAAKRTVADWRFAPALENGKPVSKTLEFTIQYPPQARGVGSWDLATRSVEDRMREQRRLYLLPPERQRKVLDRMTQEAEDRIAPGRRSEERAKWLVVVTDAEQSGVAHMVASNLAAAYAVMRDLFGDWIPPQASELPLHAYLYTMEESYQSLMRVTPGMEWTDGSYGAPGLIALHLQLPSNEHLLATMLHEAVHAYLDRHVVKPGADFPLWLHEGLAEYVANSEIKDGGIVLGSRLQHRVYHGPTGSWREKSPAQLGVDGVKEAISKKEALSLETIVSAGRTEFYGEKIRLFYTQSWLLVHFLRHGRPGWADHEFPVFVLGVAEGYPPRDAFIAAYRTSPEDLEEEFRGYVKRF